MVFLACLLIKITLITFIVMDDGTTLVFKCKVDLYTVFKNIDDLRSTGNLILRLVRDNPNCIIFAPNKYRPLPGTELYRRTKERIRRDWRPDESPFGSHVLIFDADFSEAKMWFGIMKGRAQFEIKKRMGRLGSYLLPLFEQATDAVFRLLK